MEVKEYVGPTESFHERVNTIMASLLALDIVSDYIFVKVRRLADSLRCGCACGTELLAGLSPNVSVYIMV